MAAGSNQRDAGVRAAVMKTIKALDVQQVWKHQGPGHPISMKTIKALDVQQVWKHQGPRHPISMKTIKALNIQQVWKPPRP